jgi:nucleoside-diphosphate-sugar epimerase
VAVVDFSCYDARAAEDLGVYIASFNVPWYIYISTDSVYEVCEKTHDGPSHEDDAKRPVRLSVREALQSADMYGHRKLEAEEMLRTLQRELAHDEDAWRWVALRIPDVMGPRDTSYRWWFYQVLIKVSIQALTGCCSGVAPRGETCGGCGDSCTTGWGCRSPS